MYCLPRLARSLVRDGGTLICPLRSSTHFDYLADLLLLSSAFVDECCFFIASSDFFFCVRIVAPRLSTPLSLHAPTVCICALYAIWSARRGDVAIKTCSAPHVCLSPLTPGPGLRLYRSTARHDWRNGTCRYESVPFLSQTTYAMPLLFSALTHSSNQ